MTSGSAPSLTDTLRTDILEDRLPPGTRLIELQLADRYSVSRASIRGAIGELVKEGLVDREVNRGATVRRVALDEAVQITEVRGLLEGLIAARAASVASDDDRRELADIVSRMSDAVTNDELGGYSELNRLLHRRLREISGHDVAADLINNLRNRSTHHDFRLALVPGRAQDSLNQHATIVDAVVRGDSVGAQDAMRAHLESVADVLRRWGEVSR